MTGHEALRDDFEHAVRRATHSVSERPPAPTHAEP